MHHQSNCVQNQASRQLRGLIHRQAHQQRLDGVQAKAEWGVAAMFHRHRNYARHQPSKNCRPFHCWIERPLHPRHSLQQARAHCHHAGQLHKLANVLAMAAFGAAARTCHRHRFAKHLPSAHQLIPQPREAPDHRGAQPLRLDGGVAMEVLGARTTRRHYRHFSRHLQAKNAHYETFPSRSTRHHPEALPLKPTNAGAKAALEVLAIAIQKKSSS
mmetsp:Transcript_47945/g.138767  ORF Transcript_47945/g.138767 Transcript_47945/m.138767 type:complete len:215 (-) Transcript_47945:63-707(-)